MSLREWKEMGITQEVMSNLQLRVNVLKEELAQSAGIDPISDRFKAGYIQACVDFLDIELEETHGD